MVQFATLTDLEARWRALSPAEQARADVLLGDASQMVVEAVPDAANTVAPETLMRVVCSVVKRAMLASVDQPPISASLNTAGPFTQQQTFVNPSGDLYLTKADRQALGIGVTKAFTIDSLPDVPSDEYGPIPPWLQWL